jgi:hypothetical protein
MILRQCQLSHPGFRMMTISPVGQQVCSATLVSNQVAPSVVNRRALTTTLPAVAIKPKKLTELSNSFGTPRYN